MEAEKMTEEDRKLFDLFRAHQKNFDILVKGRVFQAKKSTVMLHLDGSGRIRNIEIKLKTYGD